MAALTVPRIARWFSRERPDARKPAPLPTGNVTFMFTDIEGSTRLWEAQQGTMSVAAPVGRMGKARIAELLPELKRAASSMMLAWRPAAGAADRTRKVR